MWFDDYFGEGNVVFFWRVFLLSSFRSDFIVSEFIVKYKFLEC